MQTTNRLKLPFLQASQAQKHVTLNDSLLRLDVLVQTQLVSASVSEQPPAPAEGDAYILPSGATGTDWAGQPDGSIAAFNDGYWNILIPHEGWLAWDMSQSQVLVYGPAGWQALADHAGSPAQLGINTAIDPNNRLSVKADSVRFSHDDETPGSGDHRLYLNKSDASATASMVLQSAGSGRAEIGLTGNDDLSFRTSSDGSGFEERLKLHADTGCVAIGNPVNISDGALAVNGSLQVESSGATQHRVVSRDWYHFIQLDNYSSSANWHCTFLQSRRARGSIAAPASIADQDRLFAFDACGYDGTGFVTGARLRVLVDGTPAAGIVPSSLVMSTQTPAGSMIDALTIRASGKIGIGVSDPTTALHLSGPLRLPAYETTGLPSAGTVGLGAIAIVTGLSGGPQPVFSDGTDWKSVQDGAII